MKLIVLTHYVYRKGDVLEEEMEKIRENLGLLEQGITSAMVAMVIDSRPFRKGLMNPDFGRHYIVIGNRLLETLPAGTSPVMLASDPVALKELLGTDIYAYDPVKYIGDYLWSEGVELTNQLDNFTPKIGISPYTNTIPRCFGFE